MAEAAVKERTTDIVAIVEANPVSVLTDEEIYADFYRHVEEEVKAFDADLSTATGRKAIASLAYKITRTKTAIDNAGKALTDEWRKNTNNVNEKRRKAREDFEALAAQARHPLTAWEEAEEKRAEAAAKFFDTINAFRTLQHGAGSRLIKDQLDTINEMAVDPDTLLERTEEAEKAIADAREYLTQVLAATKKTEADARELERLREQEEVQREAAQKAERDRIAKEAADRAAAEAKQREEAAAERARAEEKRLAEEAVAKAEREKQEALQKAEAEKLALIREQERKEAARQAKLDREAAEQAKREANKKHRAKLTKEAENAIRDLGIDAAIATQIVATIIEGKIPHVKMEF